MADSKSITITGKIVEIMETKQVSDKFSKREFVVETDEGKYPQVLLVQITNDKIEQLNGYKIGETISVECNLRGRAWKSPGGEVKYFVSLDAWKVNGEKRSEVARGGSHEPAPTTGYGNTNPTDDIPF